MFGPQPLAAQSLRQIHQVSPRASLPRSGFVQWGRLPPLVILVTTPGLTLPDRGEGRDGSVARPRATLMLRMRGAVYLTVHKYFERDKIGKKQ